MLLTPNVTLRTMHSTGISLLKRLLVLEMAFPIAEKQHNLKFKFRESIIQINIASYRALYVIQEKIVPVNLLTDAHKINTRKTQDPKQPCKKLPPYV